MNTRTRNQSRAIGIVCGATAPFNTDPQPEKKLSRPATTPTPPEWRTVTREHRCPCCDKADWCRVSGDGEWLHCKRAASTANPSGWRRIRQTPQGGTLFHRDRAVVTDWQPPPQHPRAPRRRLTPQRITEILATSRGPGWQEQVAALATARRIAPTVLEHLAVGWIWGDVSRGQPLDAGEWIYPQRDATGAIVGIHRRLARPFTRNGSTISKLYVPGSTSALTYAADWLDQPGPILCPEGLTDTATLHHLQIAAIGRPSNTGGVDHLADLLRQAPAERLIVIVGENDAKADGTWPGRSGAATTAQALADRLERPIAWSLVPDDAKDSSDWWQQQPENADPPAAGQRFLAALLATQVVTTPRTSSHDERDRPLRTETIATVTATTTLHDYRQQMEERLLAWSDPTQPRGRLAVLAAPAGTGKTTAVDRVILDRYDVAAYAAPTHANLAERLHQIREIGIDNVAAYPQLNATTCQSFTAEQAAVLRSQGHAEATAAERAHAIGLPVFQTACRGCPLRPRKEMALDADFADFAPEPEDRPTCRYWQEMAAAKTAPIRLATSERIVRRGTALVRDGHAGDARRILIIDEQAAETLLPTIDISRDTLATLAEALETAALRRETDDQLAEGRRRSQGPARHPTSHAQRRREREEEIAVARQLAAIALRLVQILDERLAAGDYGTVPLPVPLPGIDAAPITIKRPTQRLADVLLRSLPDDCQLDGQALDLVQRIHSGSLEHIVAHTAQIDGGQTSHRPGGARVTAAIVAGWTADIDNHTDVLLLDATIDVPALERRLNRTIERLDPPQAITRQTPAVQVPIDVTDQTSPAVVARHLESAFAMLPEARRIGIILLPTHRKALFPTANGSDIRTRGSRRLVPDDLLARVATREDGSLLIVHFRQGEDRGSNIFLARCDAVVEIGTPRPNAIAVVKELVRRGEIDAAIAGSQWGRIDWLATSTAGQPTTCSTRGYADPTWSAAAAAVTRTPLIQAAERARTLLPQATGERHGGIPLVVFSSEPTGLPVTLEIPEPIPSGARFAAETVRRLASEHSHGQRVAQIASVTATASATSPIRRRQPDFAPIGPVAEDAVGAAEVYAALTAAGPDGQPVPRRTAETWIRTAIDRGLVLRSGSTSTTRYAVPPQIAAAPPEIAEDTLDTRDAPDDFEAVLRRFDRPPMPIPPTPWGPIGPAPWTEAPAWSPHMPTGSAA